MSVDARSQPQKNERRFEAIWRELPEDVRTAIGNGSTVRPVQGRETRLYAELRAIVLDKIPMNGFASLYPFVGDVVNNTICADLLDYLKRENIPVIAQDLGRDEASKVYFFPRSGRVLLKRLKQLPNDTVMRRERLYAEKLHTLVKAKPADIFV